MKIAILGYGQEGPSAEKFLRARHPEATFDIFDSFSREDLELSDYDLIVRSPSVPVALSTELTATRAPSSPPINSRAKSTMVDFLILRTSPSTAQRSIRTSQANLLYKQKYNL